MVAPLMPWLQDDTLMAQPCLNVGCHSDNQTLHKHEMPSQPLLLYPL